MMDEVLAQEEWRPGGSLYIDCRKVNIKELHLKQVGRSASILLGRLLEFCPCRIALLATAGIGYGIRRHLQFVTESRTDIRVGVDEAAALSWIARAPVEQAIVTGTN